MVFILTTSLVLASLTLLRDMRSGSSTMAVSHSSAMVGMRTGVPEVASRGQVVMLFSRKLLMATADTWQTQVPFRVCIYDFCKPQSYAFYTSYAIHKEKMESCAVFAN